MRMAFLFGSFTNDHLENSLVTSPINVHLDVVSSPWPLLFVASHEE